MNNNVATDQSSANSQPQSEYDDAKANVKCAELYNDNALAKALYEHRFLLLQHSQRTCRKKLTIKGRSNRDLTIFDNKCDELWTSTDPPVYIALETVTAILDWHRIWGCGHYRSLILNAFGEELSMSRQAKADLDEAKANLDKAKKQKVISEKEARRSALLSQTRSQPGKPGPSRTNGHRY